MDDNQMQTEPTKQVMPDQEDDPILDQEVTPVDAENDESLTDADSLMGTENDETEKSQNMATES